MIFKLQRDGGFELMTFSQITFNQFCEKLKLIEFKRVSQQMISSVYETMIAKRLTD